MVRAIVPMNLTITLWVTTLQLLFSFIIAYRGIYTAWHLQLNKRWVDSSLQSLPISMSDDFISLAGISNSSLDSIDHITFVSSNEYKVKEVKLILGDDYPWELRTKSVDLFEPQAPPVEVSRWKCFQAAKLCNGPVIVEDTSLCFNALNGLPGPYIKWFYEAVGNDGLAKLLDGHEDKSAYAQCVLSFCMGPGHDVTSFVGSTDGFICYPNGPEGFGWDPIFKPAGHSKTFAEMTRPEKNKLSHRYKAFREFKSFLNKRHMAS